MGALVVLLVSGVAVAMMMKRGTIDANHLAKSSRLRRLR